jgi:hypothetical protein
LSKEPHTFDPLHSVFFNITQTNMFPLCKQNVLKPVFGPKIIIADACSGGPVLKS